MYVCRHCGYISQNSNINYCNNTKCRYYGYRAENGKKVDSPIEEARREMSENINEINRDFDNRGIYTSKESRADEKRELRQGELFDFLPPETRFFIPEFLNSQTKNESELLNSKTKKESYAYPEAGCGMLGLATVPFQQFDKTYPLDKALEAGTIFPCLDMPYDKKIFNRG